MTDNSLILPSCVTRETRESLVHDGHTYVPLFCGSCGVRGGYVIKARCNFAFWLCSVCEQKWTPMVGVMMVPDEIVWAKMAEEQAGLTPAEAEEMMKDGNSPLGKLLRDLPVHE